MYEYAYDVHDETLMRRSYSTPVELCVLKPSADSRRWQSVSDEAFKYFPEPKRLIWMSAKEMVENLLPRGMRIRHMYVAIMQREIEHCVAEIILSDPTPA